MDVNGDNKYSSAVSILTLFPPDLPYLDAPILQDDVGVQVTSRIRYLDHVVAEYTIFGTCPEGYDLVIPTTTMTCTLAAGWINPPRCQISM